MSWFWRKANPNLSRAKKVKANTAIFTTGPVKGHQKAQATETYSKLHYNSRIKPTVQECLGLLKEAAKVEGTVVNRKEILAVVKTTTRNVYEDESDEVKAEVAAHMKLAQTPRDEEDGAERVRTPQEYQM